MRKPIKVTTENKCDFCTGSKCCQYVTHPLDTPRSKADFDYILWQVAHEHVSIFKDAGVWYLLIRGVCQHLQKDGRCGIYSKRPQICRDHSNDYCEYDVPAEEGWEQHFPDYSSLEAYCKKRFRTWGK